MVHVGEIPVQEQGLEERERGGGWRKRRVLNVITELSSWTHFTHLQGMSCSKKPIDLCWFWIMVYGSCWKGEREREHEYWLITTTAGYH